MSVAKSTTMASKSEQLNLFFLPYLSPGHMIPLTEMASLFADRGEKVTIITTPMNALLLQKTIDKDTKSGHNIRIHTLKFSPEEAGLPPYCENFFSITSLEKANKLYIAMTKLQEQIEQFIHENTPDCIVSDMYFPWTADLAAQLDIPRITFHCRSYLALCTQESIHRSSPHKNVQSDEEPFLVPDLPDPMKMKRSQLPDWVQTPNGYTKIMDKIRASELKSLGVLVNSYYELEPSYTDCYRTTMGRKTWPIGPVSLCNNRNTKDKAERGHKAVIDEHSCLNWLDSKKPNSVLYISFGSGCRFPNSQLLELAFGLEASGCQFIWVTLGKDEENDDETPWLPDGFEERMKKEGEKGLIIRGWAPQVLILDHPAIGGFMTHCGWNSVLESVSSGVAMVTWPLYAEQFYNEKLVSQVLRIGVEVGVMDWNLWVDAGKVLVKREKIQKAVVKLMNDGNEAEEMRKRARDLGVKAKESMEEGGSSYNNLTALIEELKQIKASKVET